MNTYSAETRVIASVPKGLFIDGDWRSPLGGWFPVHDPATGLELTQVGDASKVDGRAALNAAVASQADWAATPTRVRSEILRRAYDGVIARAEDFALLITMEMGKSLAEARGEVRYGAEFLRWFSEEAVRIDGRCTTAPDGGSRLLVTKKPVGPSLLITPWNFPLAMATRKLGPALAAGCSVVIKPAELTPLCTLLLAEVFAAAGLPGGVLNVITTTRPQAVVAPLLGDPRLRKLSFTGSTDVGRHLLEQSAQNILRTSMELGGNAPFLVFEDADLDRAVDGAVAAKLRNIGEACTAANRFYVHEEVVAEFSRRLTAAFEAKRLGRGTDDGVDLGPLIDERSRNKVARLVTDAVDKGATVQTGGSPVDRDGWFYPPTVLTEVPADAELLATEIFGPIAPIVGFRTEDEAIELANATPYGLIAYAYTQDSERTLRLPERIDVGMLGINSGVISNPAAPFGGVKMSGLGREGGREGIDEYLETVYVGIGRS